MSIALYMDHHVPRAVTVELRLRGVDVLTAYEDGTSRLDDSRLLDRAHELKGYYSRKMMTCWLKLPTGNS